MDIDQRRRGLASVGGTDVQGCPASCNWTGPYLASWLLLAGAAVYLVINGSAAPECVKSAGHRDDARSLN